MDDLKELVITKDDYLEFLAQRLRLQGTAAQKEIENVGFPFLFASGSEMLRTYMLSSIEFVANLPDELKLPDRGFMWYLFSQAIKEIHVTNDMVTVRYQLPDCYRKPFKQFYL
jgi:hypothetical protein